MSTPTHAHSHAHPHAHPHPEAVRWVREHAHALTTFDPAAPLDDLRPLAESVRDAGIVALAHSHRQSRELSAVSLRVLRLLVEEYGFRTLALEGDEPVRLGLAAYVRDGTGDPRAMLAGARSWWRTGETLDVVEWMRAYNERHPDDQVRFAEQRGPAPEFTSLDHVERYLAESTAWWYEHSGDRIVYWGGIAHMAVGTPRTVSPGSPGDATHHNAGGYLRERLGSGYAAIGFMFHHGTALYEFPAPPADFAESVLDAAGPEAFTLDLRAGDGAAPAVRAWLDAPVRTRMIGPVYDAARDADHHLAAASLSGLLDGVVHIRELTDSRALDAPAPAAAPTAGAERPGA
ncbi:erythromycin esterase family protein [Streptomyces iconiensis]|uniref:Erythromycin esterase family protein n=1 Tax=Streptomyces iconiensis TaxID=1384038 RepID=A0ABT7AAF1_9ACTN|nr:erythromycin esterase family protein [Streptomyces iconiensis]MDJ1138280.1 erythromycin esterase family protein [Streptomyces iconiensis]